MSKNKKKRPEPNKSIPLHGREMKESRSSKSLRWPFITIGILLLLLVGGFLFFRKGKSEEKKPLATERHKNWNVILVSIDTVRAEALSLYSSSGAPVPNLEELSRESIRFSNVIAQVPYTLPSHSTMLTGLYPVAHGVRDNVEDILPEDIPTMAELFSAAGFDTAGFVGSMVLSRRTGISRGFHYYDDFLSRADVRGEDLGAIERRASDVLLSFQDWCEKRRKPGSFFAFLHMYDPHFPYEPPPEFYPENPVVENLYKGEIRYVDVILGKLFSYMKERGMWKNTILVITSDHGESLHEHSEFGHGFFLYQESLHVPLLIHIPEMTQSREISDLVETVDLAPTILNLAGVGIDKKMQGESLEPLIFQDAHKKNRLAFAESYFPSIQLGISPTFSIQEGNIKFIESPRAELYDLKKDPAELRNLYDEKKPAAEKLRQKLARYRQTYQISRGERDQRSITPEEAEQFAALGYLGGKVEESKWDYKKDPKDFIHDWNRIQEATYLAKEARFSEALEMIRKIVSDSSKATAPILILESKCLAGLGKFDEAEATLNKLGDTSIALTHLAGIYAATGRTQEASEAYRRALDKEFSYFVLFNYVLFLKNAGLEEEAKAVARRVLENRKEPDQARPLLAEIYFVLGENQKAEQLLTQLTSERPWEAKWYLQLAGLYQNQGEIRKGLDLLLQKYDQFSSNPEYLFRLGILFRVNGQPSREIATFEKMIQVARDDPRGYLYLAKAVLDHAKNTEGAIQLSKKALTLNPDRNMQIFGYYLLSEAHQIAGNMKESEQELSRARELEGNGK